MKPIVVLLSIVSTQFTCYSQNINCDSLAYEYYGESCIINELSFFCEGVEAALKTEYLAIRGLGDPGHLSECDLYAYEAYGVKLELTGDIVMPGQKEKNDGFNAVMIPRIKDSLGTDYEKLGKIDSSWVVLNDINMMKELASIFYRSPIETDSTYTIFIDSVALKKSIFHTFEGVQFQLVSSETFSINKLYEGAVFPKISESRTYIRLNFTNYINPNNICEASGVWTLPYPNTFSLSEKSEDN